MQEVRIDAVPLQRLELLLPPARVEMLEQTAVHARALLAGRTVWNLNSTAHGGGVAEMLQVLLSYGRGAGVDTRWLVIEGDPAFFAITKRVHNLLHGAPGDGGELGSAEIRHFLEVSEANAVVATAMIRPGDVVLLHDPQTAGLVAPLVELGAHVAWRCHIGSGMVTRETERGWGFLRPLIEPAHAFVFSRPSYVPEWLPPERVRIIAPSIDPFSTKNVTLEPAEVGATLRRAGLVDLPEDGGSLAFGRRDGTTGSVREHTGLLLGDRPIPAAARMVLQVCRWDRLKDMSGVLTGVAARLGELPSDVHLLLAGPDVRGVVDDPEGAAVFETCANLRAELPAPARARLHLALLPMDDPDENAHLVNALQRHATVVLQKSLAEGFGLTVTEPMWKSKPVLASAVGGIPDQIEDGVSGVLLHDPNDLGAMVRLLGQLLGDPGRGASLGAAAHERVRDYFLGDRHLVQWVQLFDAVTASARPRRPARA
ncbi:glycosyltransferase [Nocardioides panaciterrulae]|uniref:Trehalose synthase n=1 Tax=Nocardioides panaciterrulae TaxID=661492 RepID=A0A7Y9E5V4_9ACTN|nr:trehalose synthase [Nocardioides panaciterrulae]